MSENVLIQNLLEVSKAHQKMVGELLRELDKRKESKMYIWSVYYIPYGETEYFQNYALARSYAKDFLGEVCREDSWDEEDTQDAFDCLEKEDFVDGVLSIDMIEVK